MAIQFSPHGDRLRADITDLAARVRQEGDTLRRLPPALAAAFLRHDVYRLLLPTDLGGAGLEPLEYLRLVEDIARVDGSTAWCFAIGAGSGLYLGYIARERAQPMTADRDCCIAGAYAPMGHGERVDGGYRVSGRWGWASGIDQARWVVFGFLVGENPPRMRQALAPKESFRVLDTWNAAGMRGTGSTEYEVQDLFVPEAMTFRVFLGEPLHGAPQFRLPGAFFGAAVATVALGIALGAADNLAGLAKSKPAFPGRKALKDQAFAHYAMAKSRALAEAGSAYLQQQVTEMWRCVLAKADIDMALRNAARRASVHAAEAAVEAVDLTCRAAGSSALFEPFERALRDVRAASSQIVLQRSMMEDAGRVEFGLDPVATTF